ncbi:MAG TPA: PAS domain S-box protein [Bacteroidota bacterium]|nr:PAS domain S-box protein [Bacteroidota bacterium]
MSPQKSPSKKTTRPSLKRPGGGIGLPAQTNRIYSFAVDIGAIVLEAYAGDKPLERSFTAFLSKLLKYSGSMAGALYRVDNRSVRLLGTSSLPAAFTKELSLQELDKSHLHRVIRRKAPVFLRAGDKKDYPLRTLSRVPLEKLSIVQVPIMKGSKTIGVIELVGVGIVRSEDVGSSLWHSLGRAGRGLFEAIEERSRRAMSESEFESTIEGMADGVVVVRDLKILYANNAMARLFGYNSSDDLWGESIEILIAKEDRERIVERSRNRMAGRKVPNRYEYRAVRKNGTTFDVEVVVSVMPYRGENSVVAVHRDNTLRHAIEKDMQQSEQMFRNVIDGVLTVGDALVVTNLEGKVLQVNSEFERLTGIKKAEALGTEFPYEWLLDEEMSRYVLWIKELREKKSLRDFDIHWKSRSGRLISVSMNTTLLYNALNRPVAMMNMARDITERKKLEEENRLQFERLRVLYELSRTLTSLLRISEIAEAIYRHLLEVLRFDAFFIDLFDGASGTVRTILSYDIIDGVRTKIAADTAESPLRAGTGIAKVIEARRSLLENRDTAADTPEGHPFGDKSRRSQSLLYVPMFSKETTIGVLSVQSYTPRAFNEGHIRILESFANLAAIALEKAKLYEETVTKSLQLQNRNKELDDFTYVVSHDLKEPLITVEGYSRILLKDHGTARDHAATEYVQSIIQACARMKNLIDDLLVLSRVSRLTEVMETVSLNDILTEVLGDLSFSIQEKHITIIPPESQISYYCNPTHFKLVLRNLVSNAIKFNKSESPFIKISFTESEKRFLCSVQDNGIGIEKRFFDKIFVIFQRLHPEYEGSGAGLAIVRKIVELYQGQIWLESEIGKGTTFYFSLPR